MTYLKHPIGTEGAALRPGTCGVHSVCPVYNILASKIFIRFLLREAVLQNIDSSHKALQTNNYQEKNIFADY